VLPAFPQGGCFVSESSRPWCCSRCSTSTSASGANSATRVLKRWGNRSGARPDVSGRSSQSDWQARQAEEWIKARQEGLEEDELVAATFGKENFEDLSETEKKYADKLLSVMQEKIEFVKQRDEKARMEILKGKKEYNKGNYSDSAAFFKSAADCTTSDTLIGGEAKMWLALAFDGSGKIDEARNIYRELKDNHPLPSIRTQAGNLLYILEAPKLKIKEDERLKIPDLSEVDEFRNNRNNKRPLRPPRAAKKPSKKTKPTWEEKFMQTSPIARTFQNKYFQVAFTVIFTGVSILSAVYLK